VPSWVSLGDAGGAWWGWAWRTPQACAWGPGHEALIARRASLEDDLAALSGVDSLDLADVLGADASDFRMILSQLAALATGRLQIFREMRELDDRLGLSPKGMAALRWTIVADPPDDAAASPDGGGPKAEGVPRLDDRRRRLTENAS